MACLRPDIEATLPANLLLLIALHSHMESAFGAFFLDHELMLDLHGAEGLQLCWDDMASNQGDTGLSIGGT